MSSKDLVLNSHSQEKAPCNGLSIVQAFHFNKTLVPAIPTMLIKCTRRDISILFSTMTKIKAFLQYPFVGPILEHHTYLMLVKEI